MQQPRSHVAGWGWEGGAARTVCLSEARNLGGGPRENAKGEMLGY